MTSLLKDAGLDTNKLTTSVVDLVPQTRSPTIVGALSASPSTTPTTAPTGTAAPTVLGRADIGPSVVVVVVKNADTDGFMGFGGPLLGAVVAIVVAAVGVERTWKWFSNRKKKVGQGRRRYSGPRVQAAYEEDDEDYYDSGMQSNAETKFTVEPLPPLLHPPPRNGRSGGRRVYHAHPISS